MIPIEIMELKRRRWSFRPRRFSLQIPQAWDEVTPLARRQRWWRWIMTLPRPAATRAMIRELLPRWVRLQISDLDFAGMTQLLDWANEEPNCEQIPIESFQHGGLTFHFPSRKGKNVGCLEFALADDYYQAFAGGDQDALLKLVATIWREQDPDPQRALRRDDPRTPIHSEAEVTRRIAVLRTAPVEIHLQALIYFGGLKAYIHRVYGKWIFQQEDDEDSTAEDTAPAAPGTPDFGWWGIFQAVAETGTFGAKDQVYQESIHEICICLVRKWVDENTQASSSKTQPEEDDDV